MLKEKKVGNIFFASVISSVSFFIITNFGLWLSTSYYAKTGAGLAACYTAAIPFFHQTLLSDLFFVGLLFGCISFSKNKISCFSRIKSLVNEGGTKAAFLLDVKMKFKPLLIDLDGVLKLGDSPAPDIKDFFEFINENKIPSCILSNSTLRTGELVKDFFNEHGITHFNSCYYCIRCYTFICKKEL